MKLYDEKELKKLVDSVEHMKGLNLEELRNKPIEQILETISIYHQELEFQNRELMRAQEVIMRSEKKFSELFYDAPVGYVLISDQRKVIDVNKAFCEIVGYSSRELLQKPFTDFIHPDFQDQFYIFIHRLFRDAKGSKQNVQVNRTLDLRLHSRFGNPFVMLTASTTALAAEYADPVFKVAVSNIDAQKRKEHALSVSEHKFRTLVRNAPVSFLIVGLQDEITFMNERFKLLTGYTQDTLPDMNSFWVRVNCDCVSHNKSVVNWEKLKAISADQSKNPPICYCTLKAASGRMLYLQLSTIRVDDLLILSLIDLTSQHDLEETLKTTNSELELLNSQRLKMLSVIGHDLRTPLATIQGFADMLQEDLKQGNYESALKFTDVIQATAHKSMNLLLNLVEWAKMQDGKITLERSVVNLTHAVAEAIDFFKEIAAQKEVEIRFQNNEDLTVDADFKYLQVLFRNLISNAVKFSHPRGIVEVWLSAQHDPETVAITVKDFGIGIDEKYLRTLFEPGTRYHRAGTSGELSSGLGLILCKEITDMHEGTITIASSEGNGTEVTLTLPHKTSIPK